MQTVYLIAPIDNEASVADLLGQLITGAPCALESSAILSSSVEITDLFLRGDFNEASIARTVKGFPENSYLHSQLQKLQAKPTC